MTDRTAPVVQLGRGWGHEHDITARSHWQDGAVTPPAHEAASTAANARRFEIYVTWSLYLFALVEASYLVQVRMATGYRTGVWGTVGMVLGLGHVVLDVLVGRWAFGHMRTPGRLPRGLLGAWLATGLATIASYLPWASPQTPWPIIIPAVVCVSLCMLTPLLSWRGVLPLTLAAGLLLGALGLLMGMPWRFRIVYAIVIAIFVPFFVLTAWSLVWMLRVLYQLRDAQEAQARLAVADERLRISRDLHDVFGRTLATIAVKSELAAGLVERARNDEASAELAEIRQIADSAGKEVRRVVRGEIAGSLGQELDGARALLASAGVATTISGDAASVPPPVGEVLAWIVREGVTNVLRHSNASQASLSVSVDDGEAALLIVNDGADRAGTSGTRTGIDSMRDRLAPLGGHLEATHEGGWFTLAATIPAGPGGPTAPATRDVSTRQQAQGARP